MDTVPANQDLQPLVKVIVTGTDKNLIKQLVEKSRQSNIVRYTPNDSLRRFRDEASFEKWKAGGREIHWLLGENDDLAGILWYGKKTFPLADISLDEIPEETLAIRLYDDYAGHGLARPAMRQSLAMHTKAKQRRGELVTGIWLQTDAGNEAAVAVYGKFGYREVSRDDKRVTMVLASSEILAMCSSEL